ncbi:MAG: hypothetical protein H8F28_24035 [Fibrella sp.]|nr:hypothetical protein [Armatimonadota bacterium]
MNTDRLQNDYGNVARTLPGNTPRRRNAGGSLVEVLIVLVVILIGIFAIIQIFPIGFTSLKKSEARLRADRLARNVTESLSVDASTLPESITFSYYDSGVLTTVTNEDPDNLGTYMGTAANKLYFSDLNKYRYVKNEPIRVPLASAAGGAGFGAGVGSIHFLTFGPIFMNGVVGDPANVPDYNDQSSIDLYDSYLKVTSEKLTGLSVNSIEGNNTPRNPASGYTGNLRGANSYVIDYGDQELRGNPDDEKPVILFAAESVERKFEITFSYEDYVAGSSVVKQGTCEITVPANSFGWMAVFDNDANDDKTTGDNDLLLRKTILSGSEIVVRDFTRLAATASWSATDPYQYKLASPNISTNANLGVIAFNPAGANFSVSVPGGTKPFTALASYAVLDWHILRDDRQVPVGGKVRTSLPSIRLKGDEFVDFTATGADRTQIYPGLFPQVPIYRSGDTPPSNTDSPDIQVFNLSDLSGTPKRLDLNDELADPGSTPGDYKNYETDITLAVNQQPYYWINRSGRGGTYPTGTIYINTNRVPVGSRVRILYKAQGDWAVAFQKAAKAYRLNPDITATRPITVGIPAATTSSVAESFAVDRRAAGFGDDRIYFHRSELNKGLTAAFEIDTADGTTRLPARQFTIPNPDGDYSYAVASEVAPEIMASNVTGWRVYGDVNGASLKTRVIWQDEQNGRNPWRVSDLETFVTRQAQ